MLVEPAKPNDLKGMCRAINRLSGGKMEQKASELDSVVTSHIDSIVDSAISAISNATSDAYSLASQAESLASVHKAGDGSDHSFIDQDVTTGGSPAFAALTVSGQAIVGGASDQVQCIVKANVSQSIANPLLRLQTSGDVPLLDINSDDETNIFVGVNAGIANNVGGGGINNLFIGSDSGTANTVGSENVGVGQGTLYTCLNGAENTAIGANSFASLTGGLGNTGIGYYSGYSQVSNGGCVFLGYQAGYYETAANKLFIDNTARASEADGRVKALVYGVFDADPANQELHFNADTYVLGDLILGANPSVISSANEIDIKPSGTTTAGYLSFYRSASGLPVIFTEGEEGLWLQGDHLGRSDLYLGINSTYYARISYENSLQRLEIHSKGAGAFEITSASGEIDFDNENLSTTGDIAALTLSSDTFRSADGSMSVAWSDTAAGSLVLDGSCDYVDIDGVKNTVNATTGTLTAWFNIPAARVGDSTAMIMVGIENATEMILLYRNASNQIEIRYKQGGVAVTAVVAEPGTGWYFVAATWDTNGNLVLYLGDPGLGADATTDLSARSPIVPTAAKIGTRAVALIQDYEGQLSDVILWNDALSQAECEAVYDLTRNPTYTQLDGLANKAEILHWWPFTSDAEDGEINWSTTADVDGTFVGNAYINSTSVIGLNTNDPLLVNGAFTVVGAGNVTGNLTVAGEILTTKVVGQGDLWLESSDKGASTNFVKSETINDHTTASAANISINADVIEKSTSAKRDGLWKKHVALLEPDSSKFMQLRPSIFKSRHKNDDQDKLRFGLYAEEVGDVYPGVAVWEERDFLVEPVSDGDPPTVITERIIVNYDTRELIALMVAEIQAQEKRIEILEKRV